MAHEPGGNVIGWLKRSIAWAVAGAELQELERWRTSCAEAQRWLSEFPDAFTALGHVRGEATMGGGDISRLRQMMRNRRAVMAPIRLTLRQDLTRDGMAEFKRLWDAGAWPGSLRGATRGELEEATDWDVATQVVGDLDRARQNACDAVDRALSNPPTHFDGIVPEAHRVAYKFLSPGCDARS